MQSLSVPSTTAETSLDRLEAALSHSEAIVIESDAESSLTESAANQSESRSNPVIADSAEEPAWKLHLKVFTSTFFTIFLAELGDKTQVTTLLMAAESHSPWIVFAGAGAALVATSAIGVCLGCWLAKRVAPRVLERSVGILLLGISALLILDVVRG